MVFEEVKSPKSLNEILKAHKLTNEDLVSSSTKQLTFKQVQKARAGRWVTPNIQQKIVLALNSCLSDIQYRTEDLFDFKK